MGFHDVRLPETFSAGSLFGLGFRTRITTVDSGAEYRSARYPAYGRRTFNLSRGIANIDDLSDLLTFFMARQGALNTFRVKDWLDYATTPSRTTHRDDDDAVSATDVALSPSVGDGTRTQFQLVTRYVSGSTSVVRPITKPVAGTTRISIDDVEQMSGWTVNVLTGVVTFTTAPDVGEEVKGGCEFDVPMRFAESTEQSLQIAIQAIHTGELPEINVVEDTEPVTVSQDRVLDGALRHGAIVADVQISGLDPTLHIFSQSASGLTIFLPDPTDMELGGPIYRFVNQGTTALEIQLFEGAAVLVASFASGTSIDIYLGVDVNDDPAWYVA